MIIVAEWSFAMDATGQSVSDPAGFPGPTMPA
jgi:hypothetical protein